MDSEYFNSLLPELRETVSNRLHDLRIVERVCSGPVTQDEFNNIIKKQKILGILHSYIYNNNHSDYFYEIQILAQGINDEHLDSKQVTIRKPGLMMLPGIGGPPGQLTRYDHDLLTLYNIYSSRLRCNRIFPNFAKEQTMKALNSHKVLYEDIKDHEILTDIYLKNLMGVYTYLYLNCYVFNIITQADLNKFPRLPNNIEDVDESLLDDLNLDIEQMFIEIEKKILAL